MTKSRPIKNSKRQAARATPSPSPDMVWVNRAEYNSLRECMIEAADEIQRLRAASPEPPRQTFEEFAANLELDIANDPIIVQVARQAWNAAKLAPSSHSEPELVKAPRFYVASRASIPERSAMWRKLRDDYEIVSTWIDEAGDGETGDFYELWARIEAEIRSADCLILYAESGDFPLKGALVEVGMALAMGKPVRIVANGFTPNPRDLKPLGSWAKHPRVKMFDNLLEAFEAALASTPQNEHKDAIDLLVAVRDSAVTDSGHCSICLSNPHSSGCVIECVEKFIHKLDDATPSSGESK